MPPMPPIAGGPPPGMSPGAGVGAPPPVGTGGATAMGAMHGNHQAAMVKLEIALKSLQDSLGGLPIGSPLHADVLEALKKIGKHLPQGGASTSDATAMVQQLAALAREAKVQPAQQAALANLSGGGMSPPPPPGAGAAPPPIG